eukprot:s706_g6.t1
MSGHLSKLPRGESTGPLSQREVEIAAGLVHRAVVHEQAHGIVTKIAAHIHGKHIAVHAEAMLSDVQGMTDASKRRLDAETDVGSWDHVISDEEFDPSCMPMPSAGYVKDDSKGSGMTQAALLASMPDPKKSFPFPPNVNSMSEWGRTILTMKKYADLNMTYGELVKMSKIDDDALRYLAWIQKTYTPEVDRAKTVKRTQAVDLAMYLKNSGWSQPETEEFVRRLK